MLEERTLKNFLLLNITVACLYFVFGRLAVLLAIPPGYATAVWPSAGIAFAFMVQFGMRVAPGVFLGSYLLNFVTVLLSFENVTLSQVMLPAVIGLGAVSHPVIAITLLDIWKIRIKDLINLREIIGVIILGGFCGCILSASFGTFGLFAFEFITLDEFSRNWFTWWAGDTLGVLTFSPITLLLFNNYRTNRSRIFAVGIPLFLAFVVSVFIYIKSSFSALEVERKEFNSKSYEVERAIQYSIKNYTDILMSIKAFYESSEDVTHEDFRDFTRFFFKREKGIQALEWIPVVQHKDRSRVEKQISDNYGREVFFTKRVAGKLVKDSNRDFYFPVSYVQPYEGNEVVLGYNLGSDEKRQDALEYAKTNNEIVSTQLIKLVQDNERVPAIILFVPVYYKSSFEFIGYVNGVFKIKDILRSALSEIDLSGVEYILTQDESGTNDPDFVVKSFNQNLDLSKDILLENTYRFEIGKKSWTFKSLKTRAYASRNKNWGVWFLLTSSLFFSSLLGVILLIVSGQTEKIGQEVRDKTLALKSMNDDLRESNLKIEQMSKYKSEFLANMSHEIRTPLNGILGMINTIDEDPLSEKQKNSLEIVKIASESLYTIINDILDFSKIEAGKMSVELHGFDFRKNIEGTFALFRGKAEEKGVSLKLYIEPSCPRFIKSDSVRISQILTNLLSNAIKFTEKGNILVQVSASTTENNLKNICILVKDSGIGIDAEIIHNLFNPFTQADSSITRKFGGSGLGLVICQKLANLLGGHISVESQVDIGSSFQFDLTVEELQSIDAKSEQNFIADKQAFRFLKVLVAEDNHINQKVVTSLMKKFEIDIDIANNGAEAIKMSQTNNYDLIFMDIQMPEVDGYEATKEILAEGINKNTPIIAMTANVFKEDRDRCMDYGMKDFIEKPIKIHELRRVLSKSLMGDYDK
ncbi:CHASE domain-containing protein [Bacteriovorax sp. Seq25_V]|uniref:CHASE domain-containing protein n=1 Tax=Bacteriovorax sp. Seq25_V TaxID=1201288 RepID=UPI000389E126|nr:CHASE domain-containing protein [Bacteriovorax sp. Seq25_V]EQC43772.1 CHASE domain protein [Bacteriovorax sp. Seq25_V]